MTGLKLEAEAFRTRLGEQAAHAAQTAALRLLCGIDLDEALSACPAGIAKALRRIERLIERERLKGASRHWSYDLNRHIALKQALDRLRQHHGLEVPRAATGIQIKRKRRPKAPLLG